MKTFLLKLLVFFLPFYLSAKDKMPFVTPIDAKTDVIKDVRGIFYVRDTYGKLTMEKILHKTAPYKFQECEDALPTYWGNGTPYWFRFRLTNTTKVSQNIIVNLPIAFYDNVDFYSVKNDSLTQPQQHLSWKIPQQNRLFPHRNFIFRCSISPHDTISCYIRMQKDFGSISLPMSLWTESYFNYRFYAFDYTVWGFTVGAFLFVAFFAFLIYLALRDRIYAFYGFYVLCMLGFVLFSQGFYIRFYADGLLGIEANKLRYFFTFLIIACGALFTYEYLHLKEHHNDWLPNSFKALIYFLLFLLVFMYADHQLLHDYLYQRDRTTLISVFMVFFWLPSVFVFGTLIGCIITNYRRIEATYYTVAHSPLFLLVIYSAFSNYGWVPGSNFGIVDYFSVAFLIEIILLSIALAYRFKTIKEGRENLLLERSELMRRSTEAIIEAEEKERTRIARDLHDGVGQLLAAARMGLGGAIFRRNEEQQLQNALDLLEEGIREIRNVSHNMMPNVLLKLGLASALEHFVDKLNQTSNLQVNFQAVNMTERLDERTEMALYRVVQEIFSNILKHAKATKVTIELIQHDDELVMTIEDNGVGFDVKNIMGKQGIGLKNIITRVEFLHGSVNFESSPNRGTSIIVELPLHNSHEKQTENTYRR